jgi:ribosome biogenesis GTPase
MQGTVLRAQSGFFWVQTDTGVLECSLRGRLKRERQSSDLAVIGDLVDVVQIAPGKGAIEAIHPRRTKLARRAAFTKGLWKEDVIVANADQILLVFACAQPEFHAGMLDRYLVLTEFSEIDAVIVANKVDLIGLERAKQMFAAYTKIGYQVVYTSVTGGVGIDEIRGLLAGRISAVTGKSGVGKSSLFNIVQPGLNLETGEVSGAIGKGRHTTRVAELIALDLPGGGFLADTPGIRELGLWRFPVDQLAGCFREFRPFIGQCYFNSCSHTHEPDCAVRRALARGEIDQDRYASYCKLREDG